MKEGQPHRIEALIPQRPPFRFLDAIVEGEGEGEGEVEGGASGSRVGDGVGIFALHLAADNDPRLCSGVLPSVLLFEGVAQAAAAHFAQLARHKEEGLLAGIDDGEILGVARAGDVIHFRVRVTKQFAGIARVEGEAFRPRGHGGAADADEEVLARATLSVAGSAIRNGNP